MTVVAERPRVSTLAQAAEPMAAISLRDVSKRFPVRRTWAELLRHPRQVRWVPVLESFTCDIRPGELFGVLGPNGAGKTTLFRMLNSTVLPDAGSIHVGGQDIVRNTGAARGILAAVPAEERSLNWRLTARENLYLFGRLHRLSGSRLRSTAEELLETVELVDVGSKMVGQFSSGMRQRLMIARALLGRPRILLLDEPTRSLDPISARRFRKFLRTELVERRGCTVVLATHDRDEALELCDRVAILHRGRLLARGQAASIASELAGYRYRIWTRAPRHRTWRELARAGHLTILEESAVGEDGWSPVDVSIPGGAESASIVLARLTEGGVPVSKFVPAESSLADLIEHVIERSAVGGRNA